MKLYTEEQLQEAYNAGLMDGRLNNIDYSITDGFTPIELPSDEEIREKAFGHSDWHCDQSSFIYGAKYVINKIQGGNK